MLKPPRKCDFMIATSNIIEFRHLPRAGKAVIVCMNQGETEVRHLSHRLWLRHLSALPHAPCPGLKATSDSSDQRAASGGLCFSTNATAALSMANRVTPLVSQWSVCGSVTNSTGLPARASAAAMLALWS